MCKFTEKPFRICDRFNRVQRSLLSSISINYKFFKYRKTHANTHISRGPWVWCEIILFFPLIREQNLWLLLSQSLVCYAIFPLYTSYWISSSAFNYRFLSGWCAVWNYPLTNVFHQASSNRARGSRGFVSVLWRELRGKAFKDWIASNVLRHREKKQLIVCWESGESASGVKIVIFSRQLLISPMGSSHYKEDWAGNHWTCDCVIATACYLSLICLFSSNFVSFDLSPATFLCNIFAVGDS